MNDRPNQPQHGPPALRSEARALVLETPFLGDSVFPPRSPQGDGGFTEAIPDDLAGEVLRVRALLETWEIVHLRVRARLEREIAAPFPGSLIRGGLGASLRTLACLRKETEACAGCSERSRCLYAVLFEVPSPLGPPDPPEYLCTRDGTRTAGRERAPGRGGSARPFALVPPERLGPGPIDLELRLFGPDPGALPLLVRALIEMGRAGIGRDRVPLEVDRIESLRPGDGAVVLAERAAVFPDRAVRFPASRLLDGGSDDVEGPARITLTLRTPLRMKEAGRIRMDLPPERLARAALRRLTDLGEAIGGAWPRTWPSILEASRGIRVEHQDLRWMDRGRYSMRQRLSMRLGGAIGTIAYSGVPRPLAAVIRAAAFAGLGKNTTFGLGVVDFQET
jgi:hypothetical protein